MRETTAKFYSSKIRFLLSLGLIIFAQLGFSSHSNAQEPWKGYSVVPPFEFGVLTGANLYGSDLNWSVLGTLAYQIAQEGWVDDVNERVWIEAQLGPAFFSNGANSQTGLQYSTHLRWDFTYNEYWTFYGLGGLGGFVLPSYLGSSLTVHPRFGVGVEYQTKTALMFRGEFSQNFMGVGVAFHF